MKTKGELIRLVKESDVVSIDINGKKPGRGAYICKREECIKKVQRFKKLEKAFSQSISNEIYDKLEKQLKNNSDGGEYFV
jgi:predicted RNA-binding protein YlxR (DUF448 family)